MLGPCWATSLPDQDWGVKTGEPGQDWGVKTGEPGQDWGVYHESQEAEDQVAILHREKYTGKG